MSTGQGAALAERWADAFKNGDVDAFVASFAENARQEHPFFPTHATSRDEIRQREGGLFDAFGDIGLDVRQVIEQGDLAVIEAIVSATNTGDIPTPAGALPATGRRVELPMVSVVRFDGDGRVAEERRYMDVAGFMGQLGIGGP